jgi:hypothetical protein
MTLPRPLEPEAPPSPNIVANTTMPRGQYRYLVAQLQFNSVNGVVGRHATQMGGILYVSIAIVNENIDQIIGFALHRKGVITGKFQLCSPPSSQITVGKGLRGGLRGFAAYLPPVPGDVTVEP